MLEKWATIEDFATLFQYFWYRDFPMDAKKAIGAGRVDWTIHIGMVVRNISDLMGLVTRFERGSRKDAILRSTAGDEIAIEWEWGNYNKELKKLKNHKVWPEKKDKLQYAVLITYAKTSEVEKGCSYVKEQWEKEKAKWPLLLILIGYKEYNRDYKPSTRFSSGREFENIEMSIFDQNGQSKLRFRSAKAFPWEVLGTRWSYLYNK